jgi:hypothetical protein
MMIVAVQSNQPSNQVMSVARFERIGSPVVLMSTCRVKANGRVLLEPCDLPM